MVNFKHSLNILFFCLQKKFARAIIYLIKGVNITFFSRTKIRFKRVGIVAVSACKLELV